MTTGKGRRTAKDAVLCPFGIRRLSAGTGGYSVGVVRRGEQVGVEAVHPGHVVVDLGVQHEAGVGVAALAVLGGEERAQEGRFLFSVAPLGVGDGEELVVLLGPLLGEVEAALLHPVVEVGRAQLVRNVHERVLGHEELDGRVRVGDAGEQRDAAQFDLVGRGLLGVPVVYRAVVLDEQVAAALDPLHEPAVGSGQVGAQTVGVDAHDDGVEAVEVTGGQVVLAQQLDVHTGAAKALVHGVGAAVHVADAHLIRELELEHLEVGGGVLYEVGAANVVVADHLDELVALRVAFGTHDEVVAADLDILGRGEREAGAGGVTLAGEGHLYVAGLNRPAFGHIDGKGGVDRAVNVVGGGDLELDGLVGPQHVMDEVGGRHAQRDVRQDRHYLGGVDARGDFGAVYFVADDAVQAGVRPERVDVADVGVVILGVLGDGHQELGGDGLVVAEVDTLLRFVLDLFDGPAFGRAEVEGEVLDRHFAAQEGANGDGGTAATGQLGVFGHNAGDEREGGATGVLELVFLLGEAEVEVERHLIVQAGAVDGVAGGADLVEGGDDGLVDSHEVGERSERIVDGRLGLFEVAGKGFIIDQLGVLGEVVGHAREHVGILGCVHAAGAEVEVALAGALIGPAAHVLTAVVGARLLAQLLVGGAEDGIILTGVVADAGRQLFLGEAAATAGGQVELCRSEGAQALLEVLWEGLRIGCQFVGDLGGLSHRAVVAVLAEHVLEVGEENVRAALAYRANELLHDDLLTAPLAQGLLNALREGEVVDRVIEALAQEEQLDVEGLACLLHLARAQHAQGLAVLGTDGVLPALTAVGGDGDGTDAHAAREQRQQAGAFVVRVSADGHEAVDRLQWCEGLVEANYPALFLLLDDAGIGETLRHPEMDGKGERGDQQGHQRLEAKRLAHGVEPPV